MKTLSAAVQNKISILLGQEPVNILEIQWGGTSGDWSKYADKDITNYEFPVNGKILELSDLEGIVKLDEQGQSQGINVILSDTAGDLKSIFDDNNIHGKRCILYQWFDSLPLSERFQLYEGEIVSPIEWNEGDRTLKFSVITKLSDAEVGFSPEEGIFPYLPDDVIGKPWPIIFGTVQNSPCTLLSEIPRSQISQSMGMVDPSIYERQGELAVTTEWLKGLWFFYTMAAAQAAYSALNAEYIAKVINVPELIEYWLGEFRKFIQYQESFESQADAAAAQYGRAGTEIGTLFQVENDQRSNSPGSVTLVNGNVFPQNIQLDFEIGDLLVSGIINGNTLTITNTSNSNYTEYTGEPFGFTYVQAGSVMRIASMAPIIYIVSLIEATVHHVQAFKRVGNEQVLTTIPDSYYEVETETMGPYDVTYIKLTKPLSSFDETFADDLYVTATTSVGPNTVDILEWLINTYTNLTIDTTSFNSVKTSLENYPSHFALFDRKNILPQLEEIAFQARCSIWVSNNIIYLKYLPEDDTPVASLDESDIDAGSLKVFTTVSEDLVTKLIAEWTDDYSKEKYFLIFRNNGAKYGIRERTIDFYIYNIRDLVVKSATFWLIRLSNIWKHIEIVTYLDNIAIEAYDLVEFDFSEAYIASTAVNCDILQTIYNLSDQTLTVTARVPVRCGEMTEYPFYRPKDISVDLVFPTDEEIADGSAGSGGIGQDVEGTLEVRSQFTNGDTSYNISKKRSSTGMNWARYYWITEETPSDVDDSKPDARFSAQNIRTSDEPLYSYKYDVYEVEEVEPIEDDTPPYVSSPLPGVIISKVSDNVYNVNVYFRGLSQDPTSQEVTQLQVDAGETIPTGTWVIVAYNRWTETDEEGVQTTRAEYVMQVPVWL